MKYLDANVFINAALPRKNRSKYIRIIQQAISGEEIFATSVLTIDEVTYVIRKEIGFDYSLRIAKNILTMKNLILLEVDEGTITLSLNLMGKYILNPRDAIHAACCMQNNIKIIVSDDADFDKVREIKREKP